MLRRPGNRSLIFCFLVILWLPASLPSQGFTHGTAIAILRTKDSILAAADSRITSTNPFLSGTACKIRFVGGIGIAIAGLYTESDSHFNAMQLAVAAAETNGSIFDKMQVFEKLVHQPLITAWSNISRQHPEIDIGNLNSQVAFFGFYQDVPFVIREKLFPKRDPLLGLSIDIQRLIYPNSRRVDSLGLIFLAQSREILDALEQTPFSADDWVQALNMIIQTAIDRRLDVGPPIDILIVTHNGKRWVQRKQECPE
jgi:hypothetical protein